MYRTYVTVHLSRDRDVYLVKSRAVPVDFARPDARFTKSRAQAVRLAVASIATQAGGRGDRNPYRGRHASTIREIFHRRGIGPVV